MIKNGSGPLKQPNPLENLITCPKCEFVYDTRFLAEHCRMVDGQGYHCSNCDTLLLAV